MSVKSEILKKYGVEKDSATKNAEIFKKYGIDKNTPDNIVRPSGVVAPKAPAVTTKTNRTAVGLAADSGYTQKKAEQQQAANRQTVKSLFQNKSSAVTSGSADAVREATLRDLTIGSFKRGYLNAQHGEELFDQMMGRQNSADEYAEKLAGEEYNFEGKSGFGKAVSGVAEQIGQQVRQWTNPETLAMAGTAAGMATIAGQAGPQALLPEEVITVPGAFAAGMSVGGAKANLEIEAGHAYQEMLDNGISESTAKKIAMAVGIGNAALELVQLDELAKSFKVLNKSGASDTLLQTVMNELKRRGVDVAKETAQEVAQEGVTIAGTQAGSKIDKGEWAYSAEEVAGRLGGTAVSSALTFGLMNAPGGARNVYTQRQGANGNKKSSPEGAVRETAKVKQPAASAAAKTQQAAEVRKEELADADSTAVNDDPTQHTAEEQKIIEDYKNSVDESAVAFVNRVRTLKNPGYRNRVRFSISETGERTAGRVKELAGVDATGFENIITGGAVDHIEKRHGANGKADRSMADINDIGRLGYVLENFDDATVLLNDDGTPSVSDVWKNSDGTPAKRILFTKKINGVYYAAVATPDSNAKVLAVESAFISKNKGSAGTVLNMEENSSPQVTPEAPQRANTPDETWIDTSQASALAESDSGYKPASPDTIVPTPTQDVNRSGAANSSKNVATNMDADTKTAFFNMRKAKRKADRVARANRLTEEEKEIVSKLLKGELAADDASVNAHVRVVYEARKEYENYAKQVSEYRKQRKADLRAAVDKDLANVLNWKDKKSGFAYSRETMERNIRDIVPDKATADHIIRTYFAPVHEGEAAATRMKNEFRNRVKGLKLSRKVAAGNKVSEAAAVQILGEAENAIRVIGEIHARNVLKDGKTMQEWQGGIAELWAQNPNLDKDKIAGAVDEFRKIYDELIEQMNEVRVRNGYEPIEYRKGYFPHFSNGEADSLLKALGKVLGIEMEVTQLPTSINGLTHVFRPGIRWFGHGLEREGPYTVIDAVEGFDRYIEGAASMIHQTDNIQRLRAFSRQIRYRSTDDGTRKEIDQILQNDSLEEVDKENRLKNVFEIGKYTLSNFVAELDEYTNLLANKTSSRDRQPKSDIGVMAYNFLRNAERRVAANMVTVNPASWLTNFIPITQGLASVDTKNMLAGMWDTLRAYKEDDGFAGASTFLTNRRGSDPLVRTWTQNASAALSKPMEYIDTFTADTLVRARYLQNKEQGLSDAEAMREADSWAAGIMADRSKGATPTLFSAKNPLTKIFTQFQLEVNNQVSYIAKDLPEELKEKGAAAIAAALMKFLVGSFIYNELYEYVVGRRPALDPLGILNDTVGDFTGYELPNIVEATVYAASGRKMGLKHSEPVGNYQATANLAGNLVENVPFVGGLLGGGRVPISSAMPSLENLGKAMINENWSEEKRAATLAKELAKPASYLVLPFGGGQLKKIYEGIKAVKEGGSYSVDADGNPILQYPVFNDATGQKAGALAKSMLFGKSSLKTAQNWVESGFGSLSAEETAVYQGLGEAGVSDKVAYHVVCELGAAEKTETESVNTVRRQLLRNAEISDNAKSVAYYGMLATEKERELMDDLEGSADMGIVTLALMQIRDGNLLSGEAANWKKLSALINNKLSTKTKLSIYREMIGEDTADIVDALSVGIDFDDVMVFKIRTYGLSSDSRGTKKEKVLAEIDGMELSADQKDELYFLAGYKESTLERDAPWRNGTSSSSWALRRQNIFG